VCEDVLQAPPASMTVAQSALVTIVRFKIPPFVRLARTLGGTEGCFKLASRDSTPAQGVQLLDRMPHSNRPASGSLLAPPWKYVSGTQPQWLFPEESLSLSVKAHQPFWRFPATKLER